MSSVTLLLDATAIQQLHTHYQSSLQSPVPYSIFRAKRNGVTITAYQSGKVLFQGALADDEAQQWTHLSKGDSTTTRKNPLTKDSRSQNYSQKVLIGSDEVGNGSYFGPLTVCSVYLTPNQFPLMQELGVKDSKLLSDHQIRDLAKQIKSCVTYHLTICPPDKYNAHIDRLNAVGMKVSLHNFTIQKLLEKLDDKEKEELDGILIDQFTPAASYLKYVKRETHPYTKDLIFEKKAESLHLSVACASIIARAAFLESLETLGRPYHTTLPSGAGANVDAFGRRLVAQYGPEVLEKTAKLHFKNTQKILRT